MAIRKCSAGGSTADVLMAVAICYFAICLLCRDWVSISNGGRLQQRVFGGKSPPSQRPRIIGIAVISGIGEVRRLSQTRGVHPLAKRCDSLMTCR